MRLYYICGYFIGFVSTLVMAIIVTIVKPGRRDARYWGLLTILVSIWFFGRYKLLLVTSLDSAWFWQRELYFGAIFLNVVYLHFVLSFINDPGKRAMLWVGYILEAGLQIANLTSHLFIDRMMILPTINYVEHPGLLYPIHYAIYMIYPGYGVYLLWRARAWATGRFKVQLDYVLVATAIGFVCGATTLVYPVMMPPVGGPFVPIYTFIIMYSIVKHQLMDIRLAIKRTLIYSIFSGTLVVTYVAIVNLITHFLSGRIMAASAYSQTIAMIIMAALFNPLRNRVQRFIDQQFSRLTVDREEKLAQFTSEIVGHQDLGKTTETLERILDESFAPKFKCLYVRTREGKEYQNVFARLPEGFPEIMPLNNVWSRHLGKDPNGSAFEGTVSSREMAEEMARLGVKAALPLASRGDLLGFLLLGEKMSEERYAEEDLVVLRIFANQASVAYERPGLVREMTRGLAHEIKMPMANIALPAELTYRQLKEEMEKGRLPQEFFEPILKRMKFIMDQSVIASRRVDSLQQMSASTDKVFETIDLRTVIEASLSAVAELVASQHVELTRSLLEPLRMRGNGEQLKIVFTNLFKNAIEAMGESPQKKLLVRGRPEGDALRIEVEDTGPGVPEAERELVFQSMYSTKGDKGTGMGLFLVRQVVRAHGGDLYVEPGMIGARFVIRFRVDSQ